MNKSDFRVTITNGNREFRSTLQGLNNTNVDTTMEFELLTVLADLLNVATYEDSSPYPQDNYSFKPDYTKHPFFLDEAFKGNTLFKEPLCFRSFFVAFNQLKEIITEHKGISLSEFEMLKQYLSLTFTYEIKFKEINPYYVLGYNVNPINRDEVSQYQYKSLSYPYGLSMKNVFVENSNTAHQFIYTCSSVKDVTFSVLHYLMLFEYKFRKCDHCGNYFATKTLKRKYCKRKSPYKKYEHLDCEQAVRNITQECVRRKGRVCRNLKESYKQEIYNDFYKKYDEYKRAVDECSSVENLFELEQFLSKDNIKKNWYKK